MRISELTTRSAKLNTGTAYFPVDQSSDTVTNKIDYAELAKQIITEYNTQTLAGTAQSVKAALDTLNSNSVTNSSRTCEDCNTATSVGSYRIPQLSTCANTPDYPWSTSFAGELFVYYRGTVNRVFQTLYVYVVGSDDAPWIYHRQQTGANSWSAWYKAPTRAEMDAVSGLVYTAFPIAEANTDFATGALENGMYMLIIGRLNSTSGTNDFVGLAMIHNNSHITPIYEGSAATASGLNLRVEDHQIKFTTLVSNTMIRLIRFADQ